MDTIHTHKQVARSLKNRGIDCVVFDKAPGISLFLSPPPTPLPPACPFLLSFSFYPLHSGIPIYIVAFTCVYWHLVNAKMWAACGVITTSTRAFKLQNWCTNSRTSPRHTVHPTCVREREEGGVREKVTQHASMFFEQAYFQCVDKALLTPHVMGTHTQMEQSSVLICIIWPNNICIYIYIHMYLYLYMYAICKSNIHVI